MPDSPYFWVCFAVVVVTGLWVAIDARINRVPTYGDHYGINTGALCWFLGCILLWIFAFPAYWVRRSSVLGRRTERGNEPCLVNPEHCYQGRPLIHKVALRGARIGFLVPLALFALVMLPMLASTVLAPDQSGTDWRDLCYVVLTNLIFLGPILLLWAMIGAIGGALVGMTAGGRKPFPRTADQVEPSDAADSR